MHTGMIYINKGNLRNLLNLDDYDIASLLIACMIHDFKHPGYTNGFLVNTSHKIAIKYNGKLKYLKHLSIFIYYLLFVIFAFLSF